MAFRTLAAPILTLTLVSVTFLGLSAAPPTNYDESKVPSYQLPDPLVLLNGDKVTDAKTWITKRRPEILELFKTQVYGTMPAPPKAMSFQVTSSNNEALGGKARGRASRRKHLLGRKEKLPGEAQQPLIAFSLSKAEHHLGFQLKPRG